jgi:hypothetical protein
MNHERSSKRYRRLFKTWELSYEVQLRIETVDELEDALRHRFPVYQEIGTFQSSQGTAIVVLKGRSGIRLDFLQRDSQLMIRVGPFVQHLLKPSTVILASILVLTLATVGTNLLPFIGLRIPFWLGLIYSVYFSLVTAMICGSIDGIRARRDGSFPDDEELKEVGEFVHSFITEAYRA